MADPLTYVFLLTIWGADLPAPEVYVEDSNLTITDCGARIESYNKVDPTWSAGNPSCEVDTGDWGPHPYDEFAVCATDACPNPIILQACEYEDSDNCFWDARFMGNGKGNSFYVIDGIVTYYGEGR